MKLFKPTKFFKFTAILLALALFVPSQLVFCAVSSYEDLPIPGTLLNRSGEYFAPALRGVRLDPHDPLKISFIVDSGTGKAINREEAGVLVRYFLAGLTLPQDELWVNLSPYEHDRILTDHLALTDLGKDMLKDDYLLKQFTASVSDPQSPFGKDYWQNIHRALAKKTGRSDAQVDSFCKVWIMPAQAEIYESGQSALITTSRLKVMVEEDYLAMQKNGAGANNHSPANQDAINRASTPEIINVFRQQVVPAIENEVNNGKNFARLRQIYSALILAVWFKDKFKQSFYKNYIDAAKVKGIDLKSPEAKEKIYAQYTDAFKKGVYDLVQREKEPGSMRVLRRHYFSGGVDLSQLGQITSRKTLQGIGPGVREVDSCAPVGEWVDLSLGVGVINRIEPPTASLGRPMSRPGSQPIAGMRGIDEGALALDAYQAEFEKQIGTPEEDAPVPIFIENKYGMDFWVVAAPEGAPMGDNPGYSFASTSDQYRGKVIIVINRKIALNFDEDLRSRGLEPSLTRYANKNFHSIENEVIFHYIRQAYWVKRGFSPQEAHVAAWYDQIARNGFELTPLQLYTIDSMKPQERQNIFEEYRYLRKRHHMVYISMHHDNEARLANINAEIAAATTGPEREAKQIEKAKIEKEIIGIDRQAILDAEAKFWFLVSGPLLGSKEHVPRDNVFDNLLAPGGNHNDTGLVARSCRYARLLFGDLLPNTPQAAAKLASIIDLTDTVEVKREDRVFSGSAGVVVMKPQGEGKPDAVYKISRSYSFTALNDEETGLAVYNGQMIFELRKQLDMQRKGVKGISQVEAIGVNPDGALWAKITTLPGKQIGRAHV